MPIIPQRSGACRYKSGDCRIYRREVEYVEHTAATQGNEFTCILCSWDAKFADLEWLDDFCKDLSNRENGRKKNYVYTGGGVS